MRLIDADELEEYMLKKTVVMNSSDDEWYARGLNAYGIGQCIAETKTIDAIPIKWIEDWYKTHIKTAFDGDDVAVDLMLEEWRKNE